MDNKRIFFIILFLSMFLVGTLLIFTTPSSIKVRYGLTTQTKDGETISFNVFEPDNDNKNKKAIIIGHGIMANKEFMKGYAIELAAAGFVAVPFDFRGHGQSSGELNRNLLINDVKAIKAYLASRGDIDMDNLGYIGYSMGGGPGNRIVKDDKDFKCFIGVGTWLGIDDRDCINRTLNILLIIAKYDQAIELKSRKREIADRLDIDANDVQVNKLYGSFKDGDATKLYLDDNSDHFLTAFDSDFIREARDWVKNTFPSVDPVDQNLYSNLRVLILVLQLVGGMGLFFSILAQMFSQIKKLNQKEPTEVISENETVRMMSFKTLAYSLILAVPGMLIISPIFMFLPLSVAGFVLMLLYGQVFGITVLLWRNYKKANISLFDKLKEPFQGSREDVIKQIFLGLGLAFILYLIIYLSMGLNYIGIVPSIHNKLIWIPVYFLIIFLMYLINGIYFNDIFQKKLIKNEVTLIRSTLIVFGIQLAYLVTIVLILCLILWGLFFTQFFYFAVPLFLLSASVSTVIYRKTGNILVGALISTLLFTFLISTLSPFMTGLDMIMIFTD